MSYGEGLRRNRCGVWCWRWVVPADVRASVGASELLRSLRTSSKHEARERTLPLRMAALVVLHHIRAGLPLSELDNKYAALLGLIARRKAEAIEAEERMNQHEAFERLQDEARASKELAALRDGIQKRDKAIHLLLLERGKAQPAPAPRLPASPVLTVAFGEFTRERNAQKAWSTKTANGWQAVFQKIVDCFGNRPVDSISRADCIDFFERLQRQPANPGKIRPLNGKTFLELTAPEVTGFPVLSEGTVNDQMGQVSGFFAWAVRHYQLTSNPAVALQIKKVTSTKRIPFDEAELLALFGSKSWTQRRFLHPHYYWLMIIALFTGARINEICQLRLKDFIKVEGVDVISVANEEDGDPAIRAKNSNAVREVPIHSELIRLGLMRWVESKRIAGKVQLFDELKAGPDGHSGEASKWFGRYRKSCGITATQSKVFHSFRAGFISQLMNENVQDYKVLHIVGHEIGNESGDTYWNDRNALKVLEVVNMFALPASVTAVIPVIEDVTFGNATVSKRR